jgi:hypothetical protein
MKNTKPLNVLVSNRDALLDITLTLTGKWTHTAKEVAELAELAEKRLDRMWMPKGKRKSIIATHTSKGPTARAYRYGVNGSIVTLRRAADGWRIIGFEAARVYPQQGGKLMLQISPEQEIAAADAMRAGCNIVVKHPFTSPDNVRMLPAVPSATPTGPMPLLRGWVPNAN